jgi:hypothetical protein
LIAGSGQVLKISIDKVAVKIRKKIYLFSKIKKAIESTPESEEKQELYLCCGRNYSMQWRSECIRLSIDI